MGWFTGLVIGAGVATGLYAIFLAKDATPPPMQDGWFGRGPPRQDEDESVRPFKIRVPNDVISDLKTRLSKTRFSEDLENTQFQYGFQSTYLKEVVQYWLTQYDWRKHEAVLNQLPQFKTTIEGIEVHFLRVKPVRPKNARVILITHGWPGSVWEFYKLIPRLTDPAKYGGHDEDAFEVICPSIPGFGFSEAPHQQGFDVTDAARVFYKLMTRLGHEQYYVGGGDWGGIISVIIAQAYPQNVVGLHQNMFLPSSTSISPIVKQIISSFFPSLFLHPEEQKVFTSIWNSLGKMLMETGYFHLQATKPDTVAAGLNDSPAGLAAYILEKFSSWTNMEYKDLPDGGLTKKFTLDELLTNVMIYWVQGNVGPSMRIYKEWIMSDQARAFDPVPINVPAGLASFPAELFYEAEAFVSGKYRNIIQCTHMPRGGHFPALEETELLANDIINFVNKVESKLVEQKEKS